MKSTQIRIAAFTDAQPNDSATFYCKHMLSACDLSACLYSGSQAELNIPQTETEAQSGIRAQSGIKQEFTLDK